MWCAGGRLQNEATVAVCHVAQLGARAISDVETTWGSYLHFAGFETCSADFKLERACNIRS